MSGQPVLSDLRGFSMGAKASAPATARTGAPVTVTIEPQTGTLIAGAVGYDVLDHRDIVKTFTISGATIVPGSLVQDPPTDANAEATAVATDATVTLGWATPITGGGGFSFPGARFDIMASGTGTVTIAFTNSDSTLRVRDSNGVETQVRAMCTVDRSLLTITAEASHEK